MYRTRNAALLRSVDDLADAKDLRSVISLALTRSPIDESAVRCAVWSFVGAERRAGVPAVLVIARLTGLIGCADIVPMSARLALTHRVIRWCVEEYFGCLGGDVLAIDAPPRSLSLPVCS
jgi:hypothetical protein